MKNLEDYHYVKVEDKQYNIHPTEKTTIGFTEEPKSLRTQHRVQKLILKEGNSEKLLKLMED